MSQPNTTPLPIKVAIIERDDGVFDRFTVQPGGAVRTGAVWGPAADGSGEWFGFRHDIDGGQARRLPSREAAVKWLEAIAP